MQNNHLMCPICKSSKLAMKYEAKYVYTYMIDNDTPGLKNETEFLSFLYDKREQTEASQYIECGSCGTRFPCFYSQVEKGFDIKLAAESPIIHESMKKYDTTDKFN